MGHREYYTVYCIHIHSIFLLPRPIFELNEAGMKCGNFCKEMYDCSFAPTDSGRRESGKAI